jgi:4-amino-4-deoxy-L-arabinose transferase-like glycosyltransferase
MTVTGALACFLVFESARSSRDAGCGLLSSLSMLSYRARELIVLIGFYFFAGLSLLAKGLVGFVIIFGVIGAYYLIRRELNGRFLKSLLWGVPLSLIVAAVWYVPMIVRHGWVFIDQFIIQHHFARFVTARYHHPGPIYFYLPVLVAFSLPWTLVFAASLWSSRRWRWRGATTLDQARVFSFVWVILPVVFFSFSNSKLATYVLPVLPAVSFLVAERIDCFIKTNRGHKVLRLSGALLIGVGIGGGWYFHQRFGIGVICWMTTASPLVLIGAASLLRPQWRQGLFVLIAVAALAASAVALKCAAPLAAPQESVRDLLMTAAARGYPTTPVVEMHTIERTAEFYAVGRLAYGPDGEPLKFEGAAQGVEAARHNGGLVLCFVPIEFQSQLTTLKNAQVEVIGDNRRVALVAVKLK